MHRSPDIPERPMGIGVILITSRPALKNAKPLKRSSKSVFVRPPFGFSPFLYGLFSLAGWVELRKSSLKNTSQSIAKQRVPL